MINLADKTFRNNKTGEIIKIIDSFEDIAILENKDKRSVRDILNPDLYTEHIDPSLFLNSQASYNNLVDKIKNIPVDQIIEEDNNEIIINTGESSIHKPIFNDSAIILTTEDDEKAELAKKYGVVGDISSSLTKQNEAFSKYLESDDLPIIQEKSYEKKVDVIINDNNQNENHQIINKHIEDPIITMFKNVKRIKDFSISLEISNKIPRLDFIEMMEDSYETSIIDYLATEFTENLLKNPQIIENMIKDKLKDMVYNKSHSTTISDKKVPSKVGSRKPKNKPTDDNTTNKKTSLIE